MTHAIKIVDAAKGIIAGVGIPFGGPVNGKDMQGEFFDKETNFALEWFPADGRPVLYEHGLDSAIKASVVGRQTSHTIDPDVGVWVETQLNMAHKYAGAIMGLAEKGVLGFSSGAMEHLVVKAPGGKILAWPWVEQTLTTIPSNPYSLIAPDAVKHLEALALDVPEPIDAALKAAAARGTPAPGADDGPKGMKFVEHAEHVLDDVQAFLKRSRSLADLRAEEGREFSPENRKRLADLAASLDELLRATEPAAKGLERELLRYQATIARLQGVAI